MARKGVQWYGTGVRGGGGAGGGPLGAESCLMGHPASKQEPQSQLQELDAGATRALEKDPEVQKGRQPRPQL